MFPDRGVAVTFRPDELRPEWLDCDHLHVSGYALLAEPVADGRGARDRAGPRGGRADQHRPLVLEHDPRRGGRGVPRAGRVARARRRLRERGRGRDLRWGGSRGRVDPEARLPGCSFDGDERAALPWRRSVDTTGAGDALAAGWIVGGPDLALEAAARCAAGRVDAVVVGTRARTRRHEPRPPIHAVPARSDPVDTPIRPTPTQTAQTRRESPASGIRARGCAGVDMVPSGRDVGGAAPRTVVSHPPAPAAPATTLPAWST